MRTFQINKEYSARSICDYDCVFTFKILRRTAKSVWVKVHNKIVRRQIEIYDDTETFYPFGKYSMATCIYA